MGKGGGCGSSKADEAPQQQVAQKYAAPPEPVKQAQAQPAQAQTAAPAQTYSNTVVTDTATAGETLDKISKLMQKFAEVICLSLLPRRCSGF